MPTDTYASIIAIDTLDWNSLLSFNWFNYEAAPLFKSFVLNVSNLFKARSSFSCRAISIRIVINWVFNRWRRYIRFKS